MAVLKGKQLGGVQAEKVIQSESLRMVSDGFIMDAKEVHANAQRKGDKNQPDGYAGLDEDQRLTALPSFKQVTKLNVVAPKDIQIPINNTLDFMFPDINVLQLMDDISTIAYSCAFDNGDRSAFESIDLVSFSSVMRLSTHVQMDKTLTQTIGSHIVSSFSLRDDILSYVSGDQILNPNDLALIEMHDGNYLTCYNVTPVKVTPNMKTNDQDGFSIAVSSALRRHDPWETFNSKLKTKADTQWSSSATPSISTPEWIQATFDQGYYLTDVVLRAGNFSGAELGMPVNMSIELCESRALNQWVEVMNITGLSWEQFESKVFSFGRPSTKYEGLRVTITNTVGDTLASIGDIIINGNATLTYDNIKTIAAEPLSEDLFQQFGVDNNTALLAAMNTSETQMTLHVFSTTQRDNLYIGCKPAQRTAVALNDIDLSNVGHISKVNIMANNPDKARMLLSIDGGNQWLSFLSGRFVPTDISKISSDGMSISTITSIDEATWGTIDTSRIRFAYHLVDDVEYDDINIIVTRHGKWGKAIHGVHYDYYYVSNNDLIVSFLKDGNFKINYYG